MSAHKATLTFVISLSVFSVWITSEAAEKPWYAGTWDSRYNPLREHPKTVAIRMELLDRDTHIPVSAVRVFLEGEYFEQWISQDIAIAQKTPWWGDIFVDPNKREAQPKEFRLEAVSDAGGVVVFALQWQKEFPWDTKIGDKWTYSVGDQWLAYLDDIQKVQRLEIRHPQYKYIEAPLDFSHVADPVYYVKASKAGENRYKLFEQNWRAEIRRKNVKMFVLDLGSELTKHQEQFCTWVPFFQKIRAKDYGTVYQIPENVPSLYRDSECGPYFVYDLGEILLEPIATRVSVEGAGASILMRETSEGGTPWYSQYSRQPGASSAPRNSVASPPIDGAGTLLNQQESLLRAEIEKLKSLSLPSLEEIRNDPTKLAELIQKGSSMKNELAIAGIRSLPMVDPDTKQMTTFDAYAHKLAADAGVGGSLGEDPVATAYMMLFDSNFLVDEAQIIRLKDGRYVTLSEAVGIAAEQSDSGLDPEVLKRAARTAASVHQASGLSKGQLLSKALTSFPFAVSELNAFGAGPRTPDGPSVSEDQALYCSELSMSIKTLTPALRKEFGLYTAVQGAVIVRIDADAPTGHHNLKPNMVIYSWGHRELISDAETLVQKAKELVARPATVRGSGRDQAILGVWKWNGTSWESGYEVVWVVGKKDANAVTEGGPPDNLYQAGPDGESRSESVQPMQVLFEIPSRYPLRSAQLLTGSGVRHVLYIFRVDDAPGGPEVQVIADGEPESAYADVSGVIFCTNGEHYAYRARKSNGGQCIVSNGQEHTTYKVVSDPRFFSDGTVVYVATIEEGTQCVLMGDQRKKGYAAVGGFDVSSNGRLAYGVVSGRGRWKVVVDGTESDSEWGWPIKGVVFSPDGNRFACLLERGFLAIDGKGQTSGDCHGLTFASDGSRYWYRRSVSYSNIYTGDSGTRRYTVIENIGQFEDHRPVSLSKAGHYAHAEGSSLYIDGKTTGKAPGIVGALLLSPDAQRLAYETAGKLFVDSELWGSFKTVGGMWFSDDGNHFASIALRSDGSYVVLHDKKESPSFTSIDSLILSSQGGHYAFRGKRGNYSIVADGKEGLEFLQVTRPYFEKDGTDAVYAATDGKQVYRVRVPTNR